MQNTRLLSVQFCLLFFCIKKNIGVLKDATVGMGFGSFRREPHFVKACSALLRRVVVHPCLYFMLFCPSSWGGVCRRGPFLCLVFQHQAWWLRTVAETLTVSQLGCKSSCLIDMDRVVVESRTSGDQIIVLTFPSLK